MVQTPDGGDHFTQLATLGNLGAARIAAALLEAEGLEVRLHGEALGPYRLTVGSMALVQIWVRESRLAEAGRVLVEAETENLVAPPRTGPPEQAVPLSPALVAAGAITAGMLLIGLVRWLL